MKTKRQATIIEVGSRDGLQNEANLIETPVKIEFIQTLQQAGFSEMELTSFVSPKWVPQMKDASEVVQACLREGKRDLVLVPNEKGTNRALQEGCQNLAFFVGVSNSFNQKNINKTTDESMEALSPLIRSLKEQGIYIRACISTAFHCPYEGQVNPDDVLRLCEQFITLGVDDLSVADTIGKANPEEVYHLFLKLNDAYGDDILLTAHFHDTRGMALANVYAALEAGINRFDSSAGGLGGCPFAPGASGNVATEDVVSMLESMGVHTNIDIQQIFKALDLLEPHLSRNIQSKTYQLYKLGHL
ncbi:hydroxymethylglutaryl-CoA lyase [Bacillus sp. FJAT-47783]|uniref:hydroxymethylglutaryl-CoA lyase n=1 Tax=Bacillus sp. FJAT-47783 TaxID=2922712 RepID=UPI001FADC7ED